MLDLKQQILADRIAERPDGGQYVTTVGQLKKVDDIARILQLADGTTISLDEIVDLQCELFQGSL